MKHASKIGSAFYVLWGVFHTYIGVLLLWKATTAGTHDALAAIGNALPDSQIPQVNSPLTNGVLEHYAWNLIWFGAVAIVIALRWNWRSSRVGYWCNLVMVSLTDLGFIAAIVVPGYVSLAAGGTGPALWVLALIFTTLGVRHPIRRVEHADADLVPTT